MARKPANKKMKTTAMESKGETIDPKIPLKKVLSNTDVETIAALLGKLTYGQCIVLKRALDTRLSQTRKRA